jgi:hypothetical protein
LRRRCSDGGTAKTPAGGGGDGGAGVLLRASSAAVGSGLGQEETASILSASLARVRARDHLPRALLAPPAPRKTQTPPSLAGRFKFARSWRAVSASVAAGETTVAGAMGAMGASVVAASCLALEGHLGQSHQ